MMLGVKLDYFGDLGVLKHKDQLDFSIHGNECLLDDKEIHDLIDYLIEYLRVKNMAKIIDV